VLLEAQSLSKVYRSGSRGEARALDDVSLGVESGSVAVVTGPSGSGKTTLLSLLGAVERPTRGRVRFQGQFLNACSDTELARVRRRMGFVFQDYGLIPNLSAAENIDYSLIPRGVARRERQRLAIEWLSRFAMEGKAGMRVRELSGGEQQRVAIARALAGRPDLVLADEPTSNLDQAAAQNLIAVFRDIRARGGTLILSSHDPGIQALATCVFELESGRLKTPR
jgi:putative ABC transport system ATP-binding protein